MGWTRFFKRRRWDAERAQELEAHLQHEVDDNVARGMTAEEARRQAHVRLGSTTRIREEIWTMNSFAWLENLGRDVRFVLRQMGRAPGFAVVAVLTLAFGIGATTAIFSIVEGVLLRPLPFADPERLVVLGDTVPGLDMGSNGHIGVTIPQILTYGREMRGFAALGGFEQVGYEFSGAGAPAEIRAARVTAGIFPMLGVAPLMGRTFTQQEDDARRQFTVMSYAMWLSRFNRDPKILGRTIELNRKTYEIIGVMPRGFEFPLIPGQMIQSQLWVPLSPTSDEMQAAAGWCCGMVGRLEPGVTLAQAQQDAGRVARQIYTELPRLHEWPAYRRDGSPAGR